MRNFFVDLKRILHIQVFSNWTNQTGPLENENVITFVDLLKRRPEWKQSTEA